MSSRDLQADENRRIEARAAGTLHIEGGRFRRKPAVEHGFAGEIEVLRMLENGAGRDIAEHLTAQVETLDERLESEAEHVLIARFRIWAHRACEWNAYAADDGDALDRGADEHRDLQEARGLEGFWTLGFGLCPEKTRKNLFMAARAQ